MAQFQHPRPLSRLSAVTIALGALVAIAACVLAVVAVTGPDGKGDPAPAVTGTTAP